MIIKTKIICPDRSLAKARESHYLAQVDGIGTMDLEAQPHKDTIERQKESIKQKLESELMAHGETKSHLKVCKNQLEGDRNQHLLESSKVGLS